MIFHLLARLRCERPVTLEPAPGPEEAEAKSGVMPSESAYE